MENMNVRDVFSFEFHFSSQNVIKRTSSHPVDPNYIFIHPKIHLNVDFESFSQFLCENFSMNDVQTAKSYSKIIIQIKSIRCRQLITLDHE
jgi:hypothetical protein